MSVDETPGHAKFGGSRVNGTVDGVGGPSAALFSRSDIRPLVCTEFYTSTRTQGGDRQRYSYA